MVIGGMIEDRVDCNEAIRARRLALLIDTMTMEARTPMMAITTNNSIRVKPFLFIFIFSPTFLVFLFLFKSDYI